ncbi:hypothetical protein FJ364_05840 [Candidatus Dependentiae bacterium]|nr:hypothetical protein [Candidatus Dependentiae bacterium]
MQMVVDGRSQALVECIEILLGQFSEKEDGTIIQKNDPVFRDLFVVLDQFDSNQLNLLDRFDGSCHCEVITALVVLIILGISVASIYMSA